MRSTIDAPSTPIGALWMWKPVSVAVSRPSTTRSMLNSPVAAS